MTRATSSTSSIGTTDSIRSEGGLGRVAATRSIAARSPKARVALAFMVGLALAGGSLLSLADPPKGGFAPDPPAVANRKQWVFDVVSHKGRPTLERAKPGMLDKAAET